MKAPFTLHDAVVGECALEFVLSKITVDEDLKHEVQAHFLKYASLDGTFEKLKETQDRYQRFVGFIYNTNLMEV